MTRGAAAATALLLFASVPTSSIGARPQTGGSPLWPLGPAGPTRLVVKLRAGVAPDRILRLLPAGNPAAAASRARPVFVPRLQQRRADTPRARRGTGAFPRLEGTFVVDLSPGASPALTLQRLARDPAVEYAQIDHPQEVQAVPPSFFWDTSGSWGQPYDDLWALKKLDLVDVWDQTRGENIRVAVVDTGADRFHGDLNLHVTFSESFAPDGIDGDGNGYIDDVTGWNFVGNNPDTQDRYGHGTHLAGLVAAVPEKRFGLAGVAPLVDLLPVKAVDDGGRSTSARLAAGIVYAVDNGADVVLSASACSARCPSDPVMEEAVRYAAAAGVLVVVAAGNKGDDARYYSPQNMLDPRPLVVSATDQEDRRESFSNGGEFVDLSAPGGGTNVAPPSYEPVLNILSAKSSTCAPAVCPVPLQVGFQPEWLRRAGTSMSAAYAAGVAALVLSRHPELDIDQVKRRLLGNAVDLGPAGCDSMFGCGRLAGGAAFEDQSPFVMARVLSPAAGEKVGGLVHIWGAADARALVGYDIEVGPGSSPSTWQTVIPTGTATVNGVLAGWNTEGLADGPWTIRLTVRDASGARREVRHTVTVDNTLPRRALVLEVVAPPQSGGSVHVAPPRAFCNSVEATTHTCSYTYLADATLTLTALPKPGSTFVGWTGACGGTGPCTLTMAQSRNVRATFARSPTFRLTLLLRAEPPFSSASVVATPPGVICQTPGCTFDYPPGTSVVLREIFSPFLWDAGQPCSGHLPTCTVVMTGDLTLAGQAFLP